MYIYKFWLKEEYKTRQDNKTNPVLRSAQRLNICGLPNLLSVCKMWLISNDNIIWIRVYSFVSVMHCAYWFVRECPPYAFFELYSLLKSSHRWDKRGGGRGDYTPPPPPPPLPSPLALCNMHAPEKWSKNWFFQNKWKLPFSLTQSRTHSLEHSLIHLLTGQSFLHLYEDGQVCLDIQYSTLFGASVFYWSGILRRSKLMNIQE